MKTIERHQKAREITGSGVIGVWSAVVGAISVTLATGAPAGLDGPGLDPAEWPSWLDRRGAVTALFSLGRLGVVMLGGYLAIVLAAHALAVRSHSTSTSAIARGITAPWARRLVELIAGATLTASVVGSIVGSIVVVDTRAASAQDAEDPGGSDGPGASDPLIEVMTVVDDAADPDAAHGADGEGGDRVAHGVDGEGVDGGGVDGGGMSDGVAPSVGSPGQVPRPGALELSATASVGSRGADVGDGSVGGATVATDERGAAPEVWEVGRGDHLWAIAEQTLASAWGTPPSDTEVAAYWAELVEHVGPMLVDPSNPDLIFPGQVFELVPVPERLSA